MPGFIKDPCKYCGPRSITFFSEEDPQTLQVVLVFICIKLNDFILGGLLLFYIVYELLVDRINALIPFQV